MFAETALTRSVGSRTKQEGKDLSCSLSLPLKVQGGGGVGGARGQTKSWQPGPLGPPEPGACLCSVESFSLSFGPADTSWLVTGRGRGGGGGELGEAPGKEKKEVKNGVCGTAAEKRA